MILRFDRKAFNLLAFIFLYTSSPRLALGKQNTPFVATRQARSKAEKYIVAIRDKGSKSFFSFSGLAEIKYEGLLAELSNRQGIKAFDHFYTFEKKVAKSFHKLWGTLKQRVHLFELTLEEGQKNRSVLQNLQSNSQVLFIEEDIFYKIDTHINERSQILLQKEQEFFGNWWQEQIKLPEAIALLKGRVQENNKSLIRPIIAILDTGIDSSHSLLGDESLWKILIQESSVWPRPSWLCHQCFCRRRSWNPSNFSFRNHSAEKPVWVLENLKMLVSTELK